MGKPFSDLMSAVVFSPDGKTLATADLFGTARLWNLTTHRQIGAPFGTGGIDTVAISPDGKTLVTDRPGGHGPAMGCGYAYPDRRAVRKGEAVALSPNGKTLVTAGNDGKARLWDLAAHHQLGAPFIIGPRARGAQGKWWRSAPTTRP